MTTPDAHAVGKERERIGNTRVNQSATLAQNPADHHQEGEPKERSNWENPSEPMATLTPNPRWRSPGLNMTNEYPKCSRYFCSVTRWTKYCNEFTGKLIWDQIRIKAKLKPNQNEINTDAAAAGAASAAAPAAACAAALVFTNVFTVVATVAMHKQQQRQQQKQLQPLQHLC